MKIEEIQGLIKFVAKSGVSEVELEMDDVKLVIKKRQAHLKLYKLRFPLLLHHKLHQLLSQQRLRQLHLLLLNLQKTLNM